MVEEDEVGRSIEDKVRGETFSCVAGKTAWRRGTVVHRHYGGMGEKSTTAALYADLVEFVNHKDEIDELMASFMATFDGPHEVTEEEFEDALWRQLQRLHDFDFTRFEWADDTTADPTSPTFGFSVAGHSFFVVGLHSGASRITRRFPHPALVFNSHTQFERLKQRGVYQRLQREIRARELALQGSLNPNLSDFGEASEARQYSGRAIEPGWQCPFQPHDSASRAAATAARS